MRKLHQTIISLTIIIWIACGLLLPPAIKAFAASASFSISVSSTSINKGDSVTVTVSLSSDSTLGAYSYCVAYDSSILEYTSGSGYGGGGTITYAGYGDGSATSAYATFTFTAIDSGSAYVQTSSGDVYTWDEEPCSASNASASISVLGNTPEPATEPQTTENTTEQGNTTETTTENTSEDTSEEETTEEKADTTALNTFTVSPGKLEPEFSKTVYEYEITVPADTKKLKITAEPEDAKSTVKIDGNKNFEAGKTYHVEITVIAENGDKQAYIIKVICEEAEEDKVSVVIDGVTYYFTTNDSKLEIPEGFAPEKANYNGSEILTYKSPNGLINCVYLTDDNGNGNWYIIDLATGNIKPLIQAQSSYNTYIIRELPKGNEIPDGFSEIAYKLDNQEITAYRKNEKDTVILLYAMNTAGSEGWYLYDTIDGTFIRYDGFTETAPVTEKTETGFKGFVSRYKFTIMLITTIVFFLITLIVVILAITMRKMLKEYEQEQNSINDDINNDTTNNNNVNNNNNNRNDYAYTDEAANESVDNDYDETEIENEAAGNPESEDTAFYATDSTENGDTAFYAADSTDNGDTVSHAADSPENEDTAFYAADSTKNEGAAGIENHNNHAEASAPFIVPTITSTEPDHKGPLLSNPLAASKVDINELTAPKEAKYVENAKSYPDGFQEHLEQSAKEKEKKPHVANTLNTADLTEIINIAESIVHSEDKNS